MELKPSLTLILRKILVVKDYSANSQLNLQQIFPFQLDEFQKMAIAALDEGKSVVVCAPTGSGKTLVGEYAIHRALSRGKRVFYTTPLKALSNQKFRDFQEQFGNSEDGEITQEIGLITGDIVVNPDAPIVVMTTEIFRNMLYETPIGQVGTSLEDVETVVLDECHYISDRGRGTVWEESIIYCPPTIQLVALSASIGNPEELTEWINQVRSVAKPKTVCELINSDFRPVPLRVYFSSKEGLFPLLNQKETAINPRLKSKISQGKRLRREDCPSIFTVVKQLEKRDLLPAIYVIFSRRGCDRAVQELQNLTLVNSEEHKILLHKLLIFFLADNLELQNHLLSFYSQEHPQLKQKLLEFLAGEPHSSEQLLDFLTENPQLKKQLFQFLATHSEIAREEQVEPLTLGIAAHHAGILPVWKELVEQLFEAGLVKVVFATATLSAGINMPARTTVISALSKRTDEGHSMLTPSEFTQIAGRAGRRGKDEVGYVVTVQTPFEGAKEAAFLATAPLEPLRSCFTPSYGMVLNLLQKHTLAEVKDLLESSFAEYLAQLRLEPEKEKIAQLTTSLVKLDVELAGINEQQFSRYEKLKGRLKEEESLLKILQQQAEISRKHALASLISELPLGTLLYLKGKHIKVSSPLTSILVKKIPGSGQAPDLICLAEDNRWYIVPPGDVIDMNEEVFLTSLVETLVVPELETIHLGYWCRGDESTVKISVQLSQYPWQRAHSSEIIQQQQHLDSIKNALLNHPLTQQKNPTRLLKLHHQRQDLREQLHRSQSKYQKLQSRQSYYWEEFLNLIDILQEFAALEGYHPTPLGEAAAAIRGENELWLGLALMSDAFESLQPQQLGAAVSALITETLRPDTWTNYPPSEEVLQVFQPEDWQGISLREVRRQLNQTQNRHEITIPVWLEMKLLGLVEQWALGVEWQELCEHTSLDEGDIVRLLRRTIDILWQIPQIPGVSPHLSRTARAAIAQMKRFPV
jgi:superfamily II RNA helicase